MSYGPSTSNDTVNHRAMERRPGLTRLCRAASLLAITACVFHGTVMAADLGILATNALKEVVTDAAARYERATGNRTVTTWSGSEAIGKRLADGEIFDVVLNTPQNLDLLAASGKIVPGTRVDFARSGIGLAVRAGHRRPDVSNQDALRKTLLEASSIGISSGPSGRYLVELFRRLGIADQVQGKTRQSPSGTQIAELLLRGEVELGLQQISELKHVDGIDYLGPLPVPLQNFTVWSGALHSQASDAAAGHAFLKMLAAPESAAVIRNAGMETM
jgi:molybdate transport system substrate-binding protein